MLEHEIYSSISNSTSLVFSGGELKTKEIDSSSGHGVRVLHDEKVGFSYCQNDSDIKKTLEKAKTASKFSVKSKFSFAPKSNFNNLNIFDKSINPQDFNELMEFVDCARSSAETHGGKSRVICSSEIESVKIENTNDFFGEYKKSVFSIYSECMYDDGFGFAYSSSINKPNLQKVSEVGMKAANMAKNMRGAKKPEPGNYLLVVNTEALDGILDPLLSSFSGDWKRRGITKISKTRMFSDVLSIFEDGTTLAPEARPFDDEGVCSRKNSLVENGEVRSFLYDRETAALSNVDNSGFCSRSSYSSSPGIGSSTIIVDKGKCKDLVELGKHIELISAHGSHTANLTSGDIGLEVSNAFLVGNGERKPIKGFMISTNLFDLFANIKAIEAKQNIHGSLIAPRIAFKDVKVIS
ncbi:MAG: TldD/PmbA family protein [Candidatus Micrarchaeota archaeon]